MHLLPIPLNMKNSILKVKWKDINNLDLDFKYIILDINNSTTGDTITIGAPVTLEFRSHVYWKLEGDKRKRRYGLLYKVILSANNS